ncbi:MAG: HAD-IA family hydrolase [Candidatus Saccharibacteria bacterium]|nr:HAD-IA family hydrolase [Candidatus Saccharibacteria bacterium]
MKSAYKLLILDYGGVYSFDYTLGNFNKIMLSSFGKAPIDTEKKEISKHSRLLAANEITVKNYIERVGAILGVSQLPSAKQFEKATVAMTNPPSEEMIELVEKVRQTGIKVSLLSDMYMFEVKLTKPWGRYEGFDYTSFSAEAGMSKADPRFFQQTLTHFGVPAKDALFVDDTLEHTVVAKSVGLATLFIDKKKYTGVELLVRDIEELLAIKETRP